MLTVKVNTCYIRGGFFWSQQEDKSVSDR